MMSFPHHGDTTPGAWNLKEDRFVLVDSLQAIVAWLQGRTAWQRGIKRRNSPWQCSAGRCRKPAFSLFLSFIPALSLVVGAIHTQVGLPIYPDPKLSQVHQWTLLAFRHLSSISHSLDPATSKKSYLGAHEAFGRKHVTHMYVLYIR